MAQVDIGTNNFFWYGKPGEVRLITDEAVDDSDKTLTVPAGYLWQVTFVSVINATSADVGNRQIVLVARDATDDVLSTIPALNVQIASTTEYYLFGVSGDVTETKAGYHFLPLSPLLLPEGYDMRIYDSAAIAAAADDMDVQCQVIQYDNY